jgi:hypothetical protein
MGEAIPLLAGADSGPADVVHAIALAFRKAAGQLAMGDLRMSHQQACTFLLNTIVDCAVRGLRDVDHLCDTALAQLRESERSYSRSEQ